MDDDLAKQKAADFFMKLQSKWEIFKYATMYKKRWPHHLKSAPPGHQITCRCRICLYICHKLLHKNSHVSPAGFYLGCVCLKPEDREEAEKIIKKLWANEELSIQKLIGKIGPGKADDDEKLPRNAERNARYVLEALQYKKKLAAILKTPRSKMAARIGACQIHDLECQKADLKRQKNLYRFIRRLSTFGKKKGGEFSRTELERRFSDKSLGEIADLLNQYREERPGFRYPSQWLDNLASKKKGICFPESYVQALRKAYRDSKRGRENEGDRIG